MAIVAAMMTGFNRKGKESRSKNAKTKRAHYWIHGKRK
eukprot:CAMPEP_0184497884 /NCGR_PEP_ID=MMETSP0113_2-20130426/37655_1 /TAXON_ID=91329 /ORGANISM="Norrisiella sphaerica, Strain BC52" /LENGTH=37 /DNA_ID= /DNA_START= /DNA_END= /DNA_ORIENTATION=